MKKLKYLFGLLIVGVGVMFTNFSHAQLFFDEDPVPETPSVSETYFHGNVISSKNGANLTFSSNALAEGIGKPIFQWGSNLINLTIKFIPVFLVIAFFWLFLSFIKNLGKVKKEKKDKDLDNK